MILVRVVHTGEIESIDHLPIAFTRQHSCDVVSPAHRSLSISLLLILLLLILRGDDAGSGGAL